MSTKELIKESDLYCFLKRSYFEWRTYLVPKRFYAVVTYWLRYRKFLDMETPKTFDEKLWWLKLNYHNPLQTQCADKAKVREYVRDCGLGEILIESYGTFDSINDFDVDQIPADEFFLKCNHLSGGNMIIRKGITNMKNEPLRIRRRGEDGNRLITVRISEDTFAKLDNIANESNYSRNEVINLILAHGVKNIEIE